MEVELEPRVKPLSYKVKGISRESPAQKATHVLDNDLRSHWSTGTNTKEWILLELDVRIQLLITLFVFLKSFGGFELIILALETWEWGFNWISAVIFLHLLNFDVFFFFFKIIFLYRKVFTFVGNLLILV